MDESKKSFYVGLVDVFVDAVMTDEISDSDKGRFMYQFYKERNTYEQEIINSMFRHLCGYSFDTLINDKAIKF